MNKAGKILSFGLLAFILGACAGAVIWAILGIMNLGITLLWETIPQHMGLESSFLYNMAVCLTGGLVIGLWQRKAGILPENMEQVMEHVKEDGFYSYNRLHIIAVSALMPLMFGGALGPEAGLVGIIVGLCYFVGDRLKYKADEVAALAETGIAAVLGIVFGAPLFGIVGNLEPEHYRRKDRKRLADKKTRVFLYIAGVVGGVVVMMGMTALLGGGSGLPRFDAHNEINPEQWKWIPVLLAVGIVFGLFYLTVNWLTECIGRKLLQYRVISCMAAGAIVAATGYFLPLTMFSGEHQMGEMIENWHEISAAVLIASAIGKIFLVNVCISLGWKGGNIFPLIFSGVAVGYAVASVVGMEGTIAVAVTVAALYAYIMRKPLTVTCVLLLCFPIVYAVPIFAAAFITSKVPVPNKLIGHDGQSEN